MKRQKLNKAIKSDKQKKKNKQEYNINIIKKMLKSSEKNLINKEAKEDNVKEII